MIQFEERVHKFEYKLNDTDDQIIEYIVNNKKDFVNQSIQSLAASLFTVPNTITRLSKKLGYDGFSHLKNSIKEELESTKTAAEDGSYYFIQKTFELSDAELIETVAKMIHDAKHVLFFGVGDSADFCEMMVRNLRVVGKTSEHYIHRHEMLHMLDQMNKNDILFLISLSGETTQILEMAERAKQRETPIISLTHFTRNSLQEAAAVNLYCYAPKKIKNGYNITDRTPVMVVLQALSQYYWDHY
ncbi:MurR/RpiR family transcriptional regulator [Neobacillus novalis]|uniref:MurR/RpiR family transcriptional regulator n=1 Tax=Neobacillus novalis TaxID=220687 RepID=A0AA95S8M9_9BACI|nr:MurR/RpiR family transcriptional regulator [Neobacillus novalis]WHY86040.1 MurR/RpiR family transcriptional regulator [Neobacillus novalis]